MIRKWYKIVHGEWVLLADGTRRSTTSSRTVFIWAKSVHKGVSYPGEHERIVDEALWSA